MPSIELLPPAVAERIAAGEVIDRPAAAVKELVENALDAGATEVQVEARAGGLRLIRVSDNGSGIPCDEVELAVRRHATSKLRYLEDLDRLDTFGFRGEALASIAAVAEVTVTSATDGQTAASCSFRAGRLLERGPAARSRGTTVTVLDLFSQMPARLKFMRGTRTEAAQIGAVVRRYALARPDVRVRLVLEGHHSFRSSGHGDLGEAFTDVYGDAAAASFLPIDLVETHDVQISGVIGGHGLTRATRGHVALFVNGRYVRSRALLTAIEEGYHPFVPRGRHAVAAIFLRVPPADLDANIHPAKLDVRLRAEAAVATALTNVIKSAFGRHPSVPSTKADLALNGAQARFPRLSRRIAEDTPPGTTWHSSVSASAGETLPALRLVGQVHDAILIAESPGGLFLVDQHRAHERIIYDSLAQRSRDNRQALIEPVMIDLPSRPAQLLASRLPALDGLGFTCEEFGGGHFVVRAAPAGEGLEGVTALLQELLQEAAAERDDWSDHLLASLACRSAIRKGRPLSTAEALDLVTRLGHAASPAVCPHGSPVLLRLSDPFLARQFGWG